MCFTFTFAFLLHQSGLYPLLPAREVRLTSQLKLYLLHSMCPLRSYCGMVDITVHSQLQISNPFPSLGWERETRHCLVQPPLGWLNLSATISFR